MAKKRASTRTKATGPAPRLSPSARATGRASRRRGAAATDTFRCARCEGEHDLLQLSFGADAPDPWGALGADERAASVLGSDQCLIHAGDETLRFVRAVLQLPVRGSAEHYEWGVWVSLSEESFDELSEHWTDPERERLGPYFGWLCTTLPGYPDTTNLKTNVHVRALGLRPLVELEPTDHPLAVQQREGIDRDDLLARVSTLLHQE